MNFSKTKFLTLFLILTLNLWSQEKYTPYDDCPGLIKSHKPSLRADFPQWAKMLYLSEVNYHDLIAAYKISNDKTRPDLKPIIRYYKQWQRRIEPWTSQDGTIQIPNLTKYYTRQKEAQLQSSSSNKTISNWTFLGPKETFWLNESGASTSPLSCPWQVNIYSFDVATTNTNTIYCGTETGFVNKTLDQGASWQLLAPQYNFGGGVTAIAISPTDENMVYVASGSQVHKTLDGGLSWTPLLALNNLFYANELLIDINDPDKIIASSGDGIHVSTDGGETWSQPWFSETYDIEYHSVDSNIIFALTKSGNSFSLIKSMDGGSTFQMQTSFPDDITEESGGLLAVTPADPNKMLAVLLSSNNTPHLYEYSNSEDSWNILAEGQTTALELNNGQGYYDLVLEISPVDADLIFVGTTTLFKSDNGGVSFAVIGGYYGDFAIHPDAQEMKILNDGKVILATDGGITISTDDYLTQGNFTSRTKGIVGSDMWGADQGWNEDILVGGRYHNGNTAIADFYQDKALRMGGAESPTGWVLQGKSRHVAFNDLGNGWILPQTAEGEPEGRFIFSKYPNMDEYGGRRGNMVFHPNYYGEIYLGEEDFLWRSQDMGITYDMLYEFPGRVRHLEIRYSNPLVLYADINNYGLYRSSDGGITWEAKPTLTNGSNGSSYWEGKTHFAISPTDENTLYACLMNGTWSSDIGKVFRSSDGGDTWTNWTDDLVLHTKNIVIQPDEEGNDLVYLFSNAADGHNAQVYMRRVTDDSWSSFDNNYPAGANTNRAMPFFRDSKLRMAGNAGFWESPLFVEEFMPSINPWVAQKQYSCMLDTLYFDDHSILNHEGATWHWSFSPMPSYVEDVNIRNPKVVLGTAESYDVTLTVTVGNQEYTKTIQNMVSTTTCPSIEDCSNPAEVPKANWTLEYVDSEENNYPGTAIMGFDDDINTIWHTSWSSGTDPYPHEIQVDMGVAYHISSFTYTPRQDGENGRIKNYVFYLTEDLSNWGESVASGSLTNTAAPQTIVLDTPKNGRYWRLVALSEVNDGPWSSMAEFDVTGCTDLTIGIETIRAMEDIIAFPIPANEEIRIHLPYTGSITYSLYAINGEFIKRGQAALKSSQFTLDLNGVSGGIYILQMTDADDRTYRVKIVKE